MARLYSNENFPKRVVVELRILGHDVLTSFEAAFAHRIHAALVGTGDPAGQLIRIVRPSP